MLKLMNLAFFAQHFDSEKRVHRKTHEIRPRSADAVMAELASRSTALGKRGRADGRTFVGQCHYGGFWPFADIFGFLFVVGPELPGPWYFLELANILSD